MEKGRRCFGLQTVKDGYKTYVYNDGQLQSLGGFLDLSLFNGTDIGCYVFINIGMHYRRISFRDIHRLRTQESDLAFCSILRPSYKKGMLWFHSALWCL